MHDTYPTKGQWEGELGPSGAKIIKERIKLNWNSRGVGRVCLCVCVGGGIKLKNAYLGKVCIHVLPYCAKSYPNNNAR